MNKNNSPATPTEDTPPGTQFEVQLVPYQDLNPNPNPNPNPIPTPQELEPGYETPTDDDAQPEAKTPVCPWAPKRPLKSKGKGKGKRKRKGKRNEPTSKKLKYPKNPPGGAGGAGMFA